MGRATMEPVQEPEQLFYVWGDQRVSYGPVDLAVLLEWVREERVQGTHWVFTPEGRWVRAEEVPEIGEVLRSEAVALSEAGESGGKVKPGSLRRIKVFAEMDDSQLEVFVRYAELVPIRQFTELVRKGDHGEAMYCVLEGELRARTLIGGKESTLNTIGPGEFFGEISILDHGPRSADVLANKDSVLLKISAGAIHKILRESPSAAAPFLFALSRSVAGRLRLLTKKYEDSIHFSRTAGVGR